MELVSGGYKRSFSAYEKQNPLFHQFFKSISGISPSIQASFNAIFELGGIPPSIYGWVLNLSI
jgi:hypothetical protein